MKNIQLIKTEPNIIPKRCDLMTGKPFQSGYQNEQGKYFKDYDSKRTTEHKGHVYVGEIWLNREQWVRHKMNQHVGSARQRATFHNVPFDIDTDYLYSIYPEDGCCPALGFEMFWGNPIWNSPSLDRITPHLGYVENNLVFISHKANAIKGDNGIQAIIAISDFYKQAGGIHV